MTGKESPWGWMLFGFVLSLIGLWGVVTTSGGVRAGAVVLTAVGGLFVFVFGVAAGVSMGLRRARYLDRG